MDKRTQKQVKKQRTRRISRVRSKVFGTPSRPRLAVKRSLRNMSVQLIDDQAGNTLVSAHQRELGKKNLKPLKAAEELGKLLGEKAKKIGVSQAVFDRRHYKYHGRVKALADGARQGGLEF